MATFQYQARDGQGASASGLVQAPTLDEAGRMLRAEGKFIVRLNEVADALAAAAGAADQSPAYHARHIRRADVILFAHQMAVMVETGVPISDALDCTARQTTQESFKAVLTGVARSVQAGGEFSTALRKHPRVFPPVMTSLVRASEISGTMGTMLDRIARYMAKEHQTRKQARGAMMYPLFMLAMALAVTIFLLAFVLPRFAKIYESRHQSLPAPTLLLIAISNGLVNYWYAWVALAALLGAGGYLLGHTRKGRRVIDYAKLHVPIVRTIYTHLYVSRACRTLGTMIAAGVPMLDMIPIVKQVTGNAYFDDLWDLVDQRLREGSQLSEPLFASDLIPRSVAQMIFSGEKSGRLGQVMARVADFTEEEFDLALKTATQFIEPVMIGVMGAIIGFVAISLLLPIFTVSKVMAGG